VPGPDLVVLWTGTRNDMDVYFARAKDAHAGGPAVQAVDG
jgi:hypothetical protein